MFAVTRIALRCRPRQLLPLAPVRLPRTPLPLRWCLGRRRLLTTNTDRTSSDASEIGSSEGSNSAAPSSEASDNIRENADNTPEKLKVKPESSDIALGDLPITITTINEATNTPASVSIPEGTKVPPITPTSVTEDATDVDAPPFVPPPFCPGCGAPSQQTAPNLPGYYDPSRPKSERYSTPKIKNKRQRREDEIFARALARLAAELDPSNNNLHQPPPVLDEPPPPLPPVKIPRCARCKAMVHHNTATPLPSYPTLETLAGLLAASRHKKNHIYFLIDAADLPMSLQPQLRSYLWKNLPSSTTKELTISYVVTRMDLLVKKTQQVASLMTWLKKTVKGALPAGEKVEGPHGGDDERFWAVSAKRGWNIGDIKRDAKHREGGMWVVGAVNVGKSRLVREVWPEAGRAVMGGKEEAEEFDILPPIENILREPASKKGQKKKGANNPPTPVPPTTRHIPPTVSHIPGTTAAPIRIVYKTAGKNTTSELIDLPGLARWIGYGPTGLLPYIREDKRKLFHMEGYVKPEQITIKPGQSLVIAGVIMITPRIEGDDELVLLAYPFVKLPVHLTSTQKAIRLLGEKDPENKLGLKLYQKPVLDEKMVEGTTRSSDTLDGMAVNPAERLVDTPTGEATIPNIKETECTSASTTDNLDEEPEESEELEDLDPEDEDDTETEPSTEEAHTVDSTPDDKSLPAAVMPVHFKSAGIYALTNDVTASRDIHLENRSPQALEALPYRIIATDILLSGLGWVEIAAQVRKRHEEAGLSVQVEVFTPGGEGVGQRDTLDAWMMREKNVKKKKIIRQRMSKKGEKKRLKKEKRAKEGK